MHTSDRLGSKHVCGSESREFRVKNEASTQEDTLIRDILGDLMWRNYPLGGSNVLFHNMVPDGDKAGSSSQAVAALVHSRQRFSQTRC